MFQIVLYVLHRTLVLYFNKDVVLTLSIGSHVSSAHKSMAPLRRDKKFTNIIFKLIIEICVQLNVTDPH